MAGYKIRNHKLIGLELFIILDKFPVKTFVNREVRFSHAAEHRPRHMLWCYPQLSADVVFHQFFKKAFIFVFQEKVVTNARADKYLLDARQLPYCPQHLQVFTFVRVQILTGLWKQALPVRADAFCFLLFTGRISEISGWTADIMDIAL